MRVVLFMAQTLNGFVAHHSGETPWSDATWQDRYELAKRFPAIIVGRTTYELMSEFDEFSKLGNPLVIVLSSASGSVDESTIFVTSPQEAITQLKGRDITQALLGGGAATNTAFLEAGLVDEIILDIEPQLFGHGIPFLKHEAPSMQLELLGCEQRGQNVRVRYKTIKEQFLDSNID